MIWFRSTSTASIRLPIVDHQMGTRARSASACRSRTLAVVSLCLLVGLAVGRRDDLGAAAGVLTASSPLPIAVAVGLSVLGVVNRAGQVRAAHLVAGLSTDLRSMLRISAAGYALNKVVKTGGLGGVALFVRHGRRRGQPAASVVAACLLNSISAQIAMLVVATVALGALTTTRGPSGSWSLVIAATALLVVAAVATATRIALRSRDRVNRWCAVPFGLASRAARWVGLPPPSSPGQEHVDRFYDAVTSLRHHPGASIPLLAHAIAAKMVGAAVLASALWAVGADIGPGPVVIVYVLALVAAATTVLPGGLGAVEATMTLALTGYGVSTPAALAGTITFRLLDLWVPVLIGLAAAPGLDRSALRAEARTAQGRTSTVTSAGLERLPSPSMANTA